MPVANHATHDKPTAPPASKWTPNKQERGLIDALDATVDRIRKVTAPDPYMLTIPQHVEDRYRHGNVHVADAWLASTPFRRNEEEVVQYQTFVFHEPSTNMFVQLPNRPQEVSVANSTYSRPKRTDVASAGPKKTISLDAYKKKQAAAATTPEGEAAQSNGTPGKPPAVKGPVERIKAENEDILMAVGDDEGRTTPVKKTAAAPSSKSVPDMKRKWEDEQKAKPDSGRRVEAHQSLEDTPIAKKARTGNNAPVESDSKARLPIPPKPVSAQNHLGQRESKLRASDVVPRGSPGLPPRISPSLMPTKLSPLNALGITRDKSDAENNVAIPPRLSPLLPASIRKALEARKNAARNSKTASTIVKDREGKLTPVSTAGGIEKNKTAKNATRHVSRTGSSSPVEASKSHPTKELETVAEGDVAESRDVKAEVTEESTLLVRLKYKKSRREDILRILKMRPRAAKTLPSRSWEDGEIVENSSNDRRGGGPARPDVSAKGVAQKVGPTQKRRAPSDESPPVPDAKNTNTDAAAKQRRRQQDAADHPPAANRQPSTPARHDRSSPLPGPASTHKSHAAANTTRRDFLSAAAMKREHSQDSLLAVATPPAFSTPNANPLAGGGTHSRPPSSHPQNTVPSSTTPATKTAKQTAWDAEVARLSALGRELKHAATAHATAAATTPPPADRAVQQKLAAVKSLESVLAYFLAFTAADQSCITSDPRQAPLPRPWITLRGFFPLVKRLTDPFPALSGLACHLGAVFTAHILDLYATHPSLSADKAGAFPRESALEYHAHLQQALREAESKLDVDTLVEKLPRTWANRARHTASSAAASAAVNDPDLHTPGRFSGPYRLPISPAASPLRAARAAWHIIGEWAEGNGVVGYEMRLKLG
jgi:hypothetical protein